MRTDLEPVADLARRLKALAADSPRNPTAKMHNVDAIAFLQACEPETVARLCDAVLALTAFARRIGYSEGDADGEYLACADTPFCSKGETHSPGCAVYEARAALQETSDA